MVTRGPRATSNMDQRENPARWRCGTSCEPVHVHFKEDQTKAAQVHPLVDQGVNTSVEDAAALQILLRNIKDSTDLAKRMVLFEDIRLPHTAIMQMMSPVPPGQEKTVADKLEPYLKDRASILSMADRMTFINGYSPTH